MTFTLRRPVRLAGAAALILTLTTTLLALVSAPAAATGSSSVEATFLDRCDGTVEVTVTAGDLWGPDYRTVSVTGAEEDLVVDEDASETVTVPGEGVELIVADTVYTDELYAEHTWTQPADGSCDGAPVIEVTASPGCYPQPQQVTVANPATNILPVSVVFTAGDEASDPVAVEPGETATHEAAADITVSGVYGLAETEHESTVEYAVVPGCPGQTGPPGSPGPEGPAGQDGEDGEDGLSGITAGNPGGGGEQLPLTGTGTGTLAAAAVGLLAAGGGALLLARRRRRIHFTA